MRKFFIKFGPAILFAVVLIGVVFSFPTLLAINIQHEKERVISAMNEQFPVTVDPRNKSIVENAQVNAFLESADSPLQAAVISVGSVFKDVFAWVATAIANAPWYQSIAATNARFVNVTPGMRKEQVASAFANTLSWNNKQKKEFLTATASSSLPLPEGSFFPGVYFVTKETTPSAAQALVNERFYENILSRYGTTTAEIVPLNQALTIASLIEREAGGADDMRLISGIIWNRLFINMNLQIDATLQYAKANSGAGVGWWPVPVPADRFRKSPYNTYLHRGLPPTPIANPSVASVLAALNPKNTSCLFYFHDSAGGFHCSDTYTEHVTLLKKYYGRGK
ncbi:MAG TPA: endolytic transglycosylase MltG [Candidatus Paceibacterota bacterium]